MPAFMHPRRLRAVGWLLLFLAGCVGCWVYGATILAAAGAWLDVGQPPAPTDYVLVLPGGAETRPYVAAALVRAGYAREVILLECHTTPEGLVSGYPPSHEIERRVLISRGVAANRIRVLEAMTDSTFADAVSLNTFLRDQSEASVAIITSDFHTRRARLVFYRVCAKARGNLRFVSAPTDRFSVADWWRHKSGLQAYLGEFLKSLFYFFRYGRGIIWTALLSTVVVGVLVMRRVFAGRRVSAS